VRPGLYGSSLAVPVVCAGVRANQPDAALADMQQFAVGVMDPAQVGRFYGEQHAYLAAAGVDGVKVDVQNAIETLGEQHGGRVALTVAYQKAFGEAVAAHFPENDAISCMSHGNDTLYNTMTVNAVRASDDFWPRVSGPPAHLQPCLRGLHCSCPFASSVVLPTPVPRVLCSDCRAVAGSWVQDPVSHTIHVAACAYNSLFMGEFMTPDWDM
jgi:raffinose synthase